MELSLKRRSTFQQATIGTLLLNLVMECFTLEDSIRPPGVKVPKETCIPPNRYEIVLHLSPHFRRLMPMLRDPGFESGVGRDVNGGVPLFDLIYIHWGNIPKHTDGCILVGDQAEVASILQSRTAFDELWQKLTREMDDPDPAKHWELIEKTWITIENPEPPMNPDLAI